MAFKLIRRDTIRMSERFEKSHIFNPDWDLSSKHGLASRVGFTDNLQDYQRCFCCLQYIEKQEIPLNENIKQLEFLGFGFPLYYSFVKNCIFLLLVSICTYNVLSLYKAYVDNSKYCSEYMATHENIFHRRGSNDVGSLHVLRKYSLEHEKQRENDKLYAQCFNLSIRPARIEVHLEVVDRIARVIAFIIHLIMLIYIRDKLTKLKQYYDERTTSPSDFSLLANHLPPVTNIRTELAQKLNTQFNIKNVADVILIPDLKEHQRLEESKDKLIQKLRDHAKSEKEDEELEQITKQIELLDLEIQKNVVHEKAKYIDDRLIAERAIIILNTQHDKYQVLQKQQEIKLGSDVWERVNFVQAPEPKEIIWENIFLNSRIKMYRTFLGWFLSLLVLGVLTFAFSQISKFKSELVERRMHEYRHEKAHNKVLYYQSLFLVFGMIFFVVIFNKLAISTLFHKFTDLERHSTTYQFQFSFCLKYCLGLFFTTALMTLVVEAFILNNYYKEDYGVIQEETIMFLVNSLFVPLYWAINPIYQFNRLHQWLNFGKKHFTQREANKIMELPSYDVGKRYGEVLEIMWFTYLYSTLIPVGAIFSGIGLVLYYWVDKYNLLRRSSIQSSVSGDLIHLTLNLLDFTLVLGPLGEIIFDYQIRSGVGLSSLICVSIALIYQFVPVESIIKYFNHEKFKLEDLPYDKAQKQFKSTYYDEHVLYSILKQDRQILMKRLLNKIEMENTKNLILESVRLI